MNDLDQIHFAHVELGPLNSDIPELSQISF